MKSTLLCEARSSTSSAGESAVHDDRVTRHEAGIVREQEPDDADDVPAIGQRLVAGAYRKKPPPTRGFANIGLILARDPRRRTLEHVIWIGLDYPNLLLTLRLNE